MRWRHAVAVVAVVALVGAGGTLARMAAMSGSSLDADERAVVEMVEDGSSVDAEEAARLVEDNVAVLLSADVAEEVEASDLASLFETALSGDAADRAFEAVVAGVGQEGMLHVPALRPVFGAAAAARMSWFAPRITAPLTEAVEGSGGVRGPAGSAHIFLRETMRDPAVAEELRRSMADYGRSEVAAAPGDGEDGATSLTRIGRLQTALTAAYHAAEVCPADLEGDVDAVEGAREADEQRRREDAVNQAMWVAQARFARPDLALLDAAAGEPFLDANGRLKSDLTPQEAEAFRDWAVVQAREDGVLFDDLRPLEAGSGQSVLSGQDPCLGLDG